MATQHLTADGVVVRVRDIGLDRYLSVITPDLGRITLLSKASHSMKSEQRAVSQLFNHCNFEFYRRGDFYLLKGGSINDAFQDLAKDFNTLNLASYFCQVAYDLSDEGEPAVELVRLLLNSLYALENKLYSHARIKGAFEWRIAALSGYLPDLSRCSLCGCEGERAEFLDVMNGALLCADCLQKAPRHAPTDPDARREARILLRLTPAVCAALCYLLSAPLSRLFAFDLTNEDDQQLFANTAETYLLSHIGHGFETLDYYYAMRD